MCSHEVGFPGADASCWLMEAALEAEKSVASLGSMKMVMGMWLLWFTDQLWISCAHRHTAPAGSSAPQAASALLQDTAAWSMQQLASA